MSELSIFSKMSALAREHEAVNLGQGFPDFDCDPKLLDLVAESLMKNKNQYAPMPGALSLRESLSQKIHRSYGYSPDPASEICITAGATQAIFTAIHSLVNKGDEVIIIEPAYDCYRPSIKQAGAECIAYPLTAADYKVDWNEFAKLISSKTKLIVINSPHNPTGSILEETDMLALQALVENTDIKVLSDEVYEHIILDGKEHQSVLKFESLRERSVAIFSFGKTLHATGWKLGYIIGPKSMIDKFKSIHQWTVFSVNSFIQEALAIYLQDPKNYESLSSFFEAKRDFLQEALSSTALKALRCHGTYFQLYSYESISELNDIDFAVEMVKNQKVACIPLSPFYKNAPKSKVIRLCFAKKESTLKAAAQKLKNL